MYTAVQMGFLDAMIIPGTLGLRELAAKWFSREWRSPL